MATKEDLLEFILRNKATARKTSPSLVSSQTRTSTPELGGAGGIAPETFANLPLSILQGIARSGGSVGLTLAAPFLGKGGSIEELRPEGMKGLEGLVARTIFGKEPVKSLQQRIAEAELTLPKGEALPFGIKAPSALAIPGVLALTAIDFSGVGGEKQVLKELLKATKTIEAAAILKKANVADDLIQQFASVFAKSKDLNSIKRNLDAIKNIQKARGAQGVVPKITPAAQEATQKAISGEKGIIPQELQPLAQAKAQGYKITDISNTPLGKQKGFIYRIEKGRDKMYAKNEAEIGGLIKLESTISPELSSLAQEARKYKSAEDYINGEAIKAKLLDNGIKVNPDNTVFLYHATSPENIVKINSEGIIKGSGTATGGMTGLGLKPSAFLGTDKKWTQETWGQSGKVIEVKVPVQDIRQPAQNMKEVYFEGGLKRGPDGIWRPIEKPRDTFYNKLAKRDYIEEQKLIDAFHQDLLARANGVIPKELQPLAEHAKKSKTFDEFITKFKEEAGNFCIEL